ncbi:hypothetical protein BSKO_03505 [Bryopsis sp. KO-2023]|nr:hypothetical protein BSKO_03505 [Bryopsis sp. KO-2023]
MDPSSQITTDDDGSDSLGDPSVDHLFGQSASTPLRRKRAVKRRGRTSEGESTQVSHDSHPPGPAASSSAEWDSASALLPPFPRIPQEHQNASALPGISEAGNAETPCGKAPSQNELDLDLQERLRQNLLERRRREEALDGGGSGGGGVDGANTKFHRNVTIRLDKNTVREYVPPSVGHGAVSALSEASGCAGREELGTGSQSGDASISITTLKRMSQFMKNEGSGREEASSTDNASSDSEGNGAEELGLFEQDAPNLTASGSGVHINSFLFLDQEQPPPSHDRGQTGDAFQGTLIKRMSQLIPGRQTPISNIQSPDQEASTSGEESRSVSFVNADSPDASTDVAHSQQADRLRRLSNTLAPRNMPYVDSGEDWDSEGDTRSSRSNRISSSLRNQLPDSNPNWDSGGDDSDGPSYPDARSGPDQEQALEYTQRLEALCTEQAQIVESLRDSWTQCTQLETNLSEGFQRFEDLNRLAEEGSGARSGEVELLFTVLHGVSAKKIEMEGTLKLVQTAAKQISAQSRPGAQRLAADNSSLESFVASLQNQINERDLELKEAREAAEAYTEDREDLHEAIEQLQQLLQCSDDELEALRKENQELHEKSLSDKNRISELELVQFSVDELNALKEENREMELQISSNKKEVAELLSTQEANQGSTDAKSVASQCHEAGLEEELKEKSDSEDNEIMNIKVEEMQLQLAALQKERDELQRTVDRLEQESIIKDEHTGSLEIEAKSLQETCNKLRIEVDKLHESNLDEQTVDQEERVAGGEPHFLGGDNLVELAGSSPPSDTEADHPFIPSREVLERGNLEDREDKEIAGSLENEFESKSVKTEGVQANIQNAEMSELQARSEAVERENAQLSEALQEASEKYLQEIERLQQGSEELLLWREQLQVLETENTRLRKSLEEAEKRPGDKSLREQLDSQARMNEELRSNHAFLTHRLAELSDRLGSGELHTCTTAEVAREVTTRNTELLARIGDLENLVARQEGEKARLEGELHQLLERICESQPPVERSSSCPVPNQECTEDALRILKRELEAAVSERDVLIGKAAHDREELTSLKRQESTHAVAVESLQKRIADLEQQIQEASPLSNPTGHKERTVSRRGSFLKKFMGVLQKNSNPGGSTLQRVASERNDSDVDAGRRADSTREPSPESHASMGFIDVPPESSSLDPKEMIHVLRSKLVDAITYIKSQRDILSSVRERLAKVEEDCEAKLNDTERSLGLERESKERAEILLGEGSQLMKSLVTTMRACLRTNMGDDGAEMSGLLDRMIRMLGGMDDDPCVRRRYPSSGHLLGPLESGTEPVPPE